MNNLKKINQQMDSRNIIKQMNKENNTDIKEYFIIKEKIIKNNLKREIV